MREVEFSVETMACDPDSLASYCRGSLPGEAWFLLEQAHRCLAGKLADLPADWAQSLLCCTIFGMEAEIRVEQDSNASLVMRVIREGNGQKAWARTNAYILRKHRLTAGFYSSGLSGLEHTEYFVADKSGMPVLAAERLSGLTTRHGGQ